MDSWESSACYPRRTFYSLSDGPPHVGPPDHYDRLSSLFDLSVSQSGEPRDDLGDLVQVNLLGGRGALPQIHGDLSCPVFRIVELLRSELLDHTIAQDRTAGIPFASRRLDDGISEGSEKLSCLDSRECPAFRIERQHGPSFRRRRVYGGRHRLADGFMLLHRFEYFFG